MTYEEYLKELIKERDNKIEDLELVIATGEITKSKRVHIGNKVAKRLRIENDQLKQIIAELSGRIVRLPFGGTIGETKDLRETNRNSDPRVSET